MCIFWRLGASLPPHLESSYDLNAFRRLLLKFLCIWSSGESAEKSAHAKSFFDSFDEPCANKPYNSIFNAEPFCRSCMQQTTLLELTDRWLRICCKGAPASFACQSLPALVKKRHAIRRLSILPPFRWYNMIRDTWSAPGFARGPRVLSQT